MVGGNTQIKIPYFYGLTVVNFIQIFVLLVRRNLNITEFWKKINNQGDSNSN